MTYAFGIVIPNRQSNETAARASLPTFRTLKKHVQLVPSKKATYEPCKVAATRDEFLNKAALEEMFVGSRKKFLSIAYSILRNREDAEDAVQEAFLSAYRHVGSFEGRSALRTWLTRIVLNAALLIQRKRKPSTIHPVPPNSNLHEVTWTENIPASEPDPEMVHAERETLQLVDGVLGAMKPVLRQAFQIVYFEELSRPEACAMLGVSIDTFKARLFRAKRQVFDQTKQTLVAPIRKNTFRRLHL